MFRSNALILAYAFGPSAAKDTHTHIQNTRQIKRIQFVYIDFMEFRFVLCHFICIYIFGSCASFSRYDVKCVQIVEQFIAFFLSYIFMISKPHTHIHFYFSHQLNKICGGVTHRKKVSQHHTWRLECVHYCICVCVCALISFYCDVIFS